MFMEIAIGAIGIGIVLMVGYIIISQVNSALPIPSLGANPCFGVVLGSNTVANTTPAGGTTCNVSLHTSVQNLTAGLTDTNVTNGLSGVQVTIFAGFGLIAVGIIVLAAFGLINIFK